MRVRFAAWSVVVGLSFVFFGPFVGESQAQKKAPDKAAKIKTLQAERDKLMKRLAVLEAELAELTRPEWTLDLKKMNIPETAATGQILRENFKVERARLTPIGTLELEHGKSRLVIFLGLKVGQPIEGKSFEFRADDKEMGKRPSIHVQIYAEKTTRPKMQFFSTDYAMRLEFGKQKDNAIPVRLYLCLDDGGRSVLAGTFTVDLK